MAALVRMALPPKASAYPTLNALRSRAKILGYVPAQVSAEGHAKRGPISTAIVVNRARHVRPNER